jgi:hypothetical protein
MIDGLGGWDAVEEGVVDVGPEFLDDEGYGVDADVEAPLVGGVAEGALADGVVNAGEAGGGSCADDFARVEDFLAGVGTGDDDAGESVAGALEEAAVAEGVIAVVLVGDGGDDGFDEEVFAGLVDGCVPEVAAVGDAASTELGVRVGFEVVAGEGQGNEEGGVVEGVFAGGDELVFHRLGWEFNIGADGTEVGKDAEDAMGLRRGLLIGGRLRLRLQGVDGGGRGGLLIRVRAGRNIEIESGGYNGCLGRNGCGRWIRGGRLLRVQGGSQNEDGQREGTRVFQRKKMVHYSP